MTRERETRDVQIKNKRPKRVPIHEQKRDVLKVSNEDPNYHYRIVNDIKEPNGESRVSMFERGGYEVVTNPDVKVGSVDGSNDASLGGSPRMIVDKSTGRKAVVMRIPKELYNADQRDKQKKITDDENKLLRRKRNPDQRTEDGDYGEVKIGK